ncbi:hypothetical protein SEPCBS119000_001112 [Sporothrix epigloea]|uniref:Phosphoglycerate mutase family protein n=1 Tax=Sporothrix epigloea TaxID=1892477 RepID=A0ABP0DAG0_9PEZI
MHQTTGADHYIPPVPHSAISSRSPAPANYVAHARDACVDLDYQWDSMRPPYDWGDGGELGEEWTSMHRRFRKGIQKLVDWYSVHEAPAELVAQKIHFDARHLTAESNGDTLDKGECAIDDDDESDADEDSVDESVVILVSHGAGCNALIGAITQQPVLVDVGLASLSVAARRPGKETFECHPDGEDSHASKWTGAVHSGHPGGIVPLNKYYEMKLFADSEHLRSVPTTPVTSRSSMATVFGATRSRHSNSLSGTPGSSSLYNTGIVGHRSSSGTFPRTAQATNTAANERPTTSSHRQVLTGNPSFSPPTLFTSRTGHFRSASIGLWSPISPKDFEKDKVTLNEGYQDDDNDSDMEILLSFDSKKSSTLQEDPKKIPCSINERDLADRNNPSPLYPIHSTDSSRDDVNDKEENTLNRGFAALTSALPRLDTGVSTTGVIGSLFPGPAPASAS